MRDETLLCSIIHNNCAVLPRRVPGRIRTMQSFWFLLLQGFTTLARLLRPGGIKSVLAENLLIKQQLLVMYRARRQAPA